MEDYRTSTRMFFLSLHSMTRAIRSRSADAPLDFEIFSSPPYRAPNLSVAGRGKSHDPFKEIFGMKEEYIGRFTEIYKDIPRGQQAKASALIERLADTLVMMDECTEHLQAEGCVSEMCQGKYSIQRINPWSQAYDAKAKIMLSILEKLDKMLPDQKSDGIAKAGENLAKLVAGGKPIELR